MSDDLKQIANRIKEIREISGISIESVANEFSISTDLYKKYENGDLDIPIGFLYQVANKFNIELTALITGEEPKLKIYSLVKKGKGAVIERRKEYKYQDLGYNFINKKAETFLVTVDYKKENEPIKTYSHTGQEFNYVLEGTLKLIINEKELILEPGDSIYFNSGYNHGMKALNGKEAKFLAVIF